MNGFRARFAAAESIILEKLGDDALLDGRAVKGALLTPDDIVRLGGSLTGFQGNVFRLPEAQAVGVGMGSEIVFSGAIYSVQHFYQDGTGFTMLELRLE